MTLSIVIPSYNARELLRRALSVNLGIEASTGDYVLLLNSDLFLTQEALVSMIERLSANPQVGAVAPSLHNEDGSRQLSFGLFGGLYWPNWLAVKKPSSVPLVSFACVMTRRDVLTRLGALDENFFLYNEEYDWCLRARQAGFDIEILPAPVVHVGAGSTSPSPQLVLEEQRGFLYFASKHTSPFIANWLRRVMRGQGFVLKHLDPRTQAS